jgi:hypothetical protein
MNNNQIKSNYCSKEFNVDGQQIINTYQCSDKKFNASDLWQIQKNKKQFSFGHAINSIV